MLFRRPCEIRTAKPEDVQELVSIQKEARESSQWDAPDYLAFECQVAVLHETIAGFVVSRTLVDAEREILNVAVRPTYRRRGIATQLIKSELQRHAADHFLEVRESNAAARALYGTLGFREVGTRPAYYDDPPEAAIVMRFSAR